MGKGTSKQRCFDVETRRRNLVVYVNWIDVEIRRPCDVIYQRCPDVGYTLKQRCGLFPIILFVYFHKIHL